MYTGTRMFLLLTTQLQHRRDYIALPFTCCPFIHFSVQYHISRIKANPHSFTLQSFQDPDSRECWNYLVLRSLIIYWKTVWCVDVKR